MSRQFWFFVVLLLVTYLVRGNSFFWDTVQLASKQGHFVYETGFQSIILPPEIDSGHPPLFGAYMALVWKIFGKTLSVSHFAMLPFLFGIVHYLFRIGGKLLGSNQAPWLCLLCFADPVLSSQSVLISPDVVLICFFLMAVWSIWRENWAGTSFAIIVLCLISMRGMMLGLGLLAFSLTTTKWVWQPVILFRKTAPFLPGFLLAFGFLVYHWQKTGWVGHHPASTWAPSFETVGIDGFAKNILILGWRSLDFGRVFIWLAFIPLLFYWYKRHRNTTEHPEGKELGRQLITLTVCVFLATVPLQLLYKGLLAHRYLPPFFMTLTFTTLYLLKEYSLKTTKQGIMKFARPLIAIGLVTGNFWVYPNSVSMGWDSTLAHLPWYGLQNQVNQFLTEKGIPYEAVGTAFPNIGPRELHELNGEQNGYVEKDFDDNCYIFYSNIMNDFTDKEIAELTANWQPVFAQKSGGVEVVLYKNPNKRSCEN